MLPGSHGDTLTRPSEVNVEVVVEEAHDLHHRKNLVRWRIFSPCILEGDWFSCAPRSVQDRSQFTSPVDKPTVGTHVARESFAIGSDTDSLTEAADQVDQSEGSDDGRPVSEVDDEFGPHEELLGEEVPPVRPSVARCALASFSWIDLRDLFRQRGCLLKYLSENSFGRESRRGKKEERAPARARVEAQLESGTI